MLKNISILFDLKLTKNNYKMNAYAEKIDIIQWITSLKDKSTLQLLSKIKEQSTKNKDWWTVISEEERLSIEKGLDDLSNDKVTSHSEVRKKYEKWL